MSDKKEGRQVLELRYAMKGDPTNIEIATRYWRALATYDGKYDIRSGSHVVEAFRETALSSPEGVLALANAYKELFAISGEGPRPEYFDENLTNSLRRSLTELPEEQRSVVQWVLDSLPR
jgi:hypothetical protein